MGGLFGGVSNALFGDGGASDLEGIAAQNQQLYNNIQTPDLQYQTYNPQNYNPQMAQANLVQNDPLVQSAQMSALAKMSGLADQGLNAQDQQAFSQAGNLANQQAQQQTQAALQNAQDRGVGGSGLEFAMREMGNQGAAQMQRQNNIDQASSAAQNRVLANNSYLSALGGQRSQDYQQNAGNAGIMNQFNAMNTGNMNQAGMYNTGNMNQAQMYNQQNRNNIAQQNFSNQMSKVGGQAGANQGYLNAAAAGQAAQTANQNALFGAAANIGGAALGGYMARPTQNPAGGFAGTSMAGSSGLDTSGMA